MIRLKMLISVAAICTMSATPAIIGAQEQTIHHVYTNTTNVRRYVQDVERESNSFRDEFEHKYKKMFISNYKRTDKAMHAVQHLDEALEHARRQATLENPRYARDEIQKVVERARIVDRLFRDPDQILATMRDDWKPLREDIQQLADLYELPGLDG